MNIGDKVQQITTREVGVVVHVDTSDGIEDCYVCFFGTTFPEGRPVRLPYVLRYYSSSLEKI